MSQLEALGRFRREKRAGAVAHSEGLGGGGRAGCAGGVDGQLSVSVYNAVIDVCGAAGHWRRALMVLNRMTHRGIPPNTITFELLVRAGAQARGSEPSEVYSAMAMVGVPEFLAYTAGTAKTMHHETLHPDFLV